MDKTTYWNNRKEGKRGQGEKPKIVNLVETGEATHNRAYRRRKLVDRLMTKKGYRNGVQISA